MRRRTILLITILGLIVYHGITHRKQLNVGRDNAWDCSEMALVDLHVPDAVTSYLSPYHASIPTTGLSIVPPAGYMGMAGMAGFRRDNDTCIDVIEDHTIGLGSKKKVVTDYIATLQKANSHEAEVLYKKDFKFNGYDAFVVCVSDTTRTRTAIYMAFGDDRFNVAMTGTMADNSAANRTEIINAMLSAYYQKA